MPLPSAVQKIGDAAEAAAVAAGMTGKPGAAVPGAASPTTVIQPVQPIANEPAAKVDPEDYKERYSRYKVSTDRTISELRETVAGLQGQVEVLNTRPVVVPAAPAVPAVDPGKLPADFENDPGYRAWFDGLSASKETYDKDFLHFQYEMHLKDLAAKGQQPADSAALQNRVNSLEQHQALSEGQQYEADLDASFPNNEWIDIAHGEQWDDFCRSKPSPYSNQTYGQLVAENDNGKRTLNNSGAVIRENGNCNSPVIIQVLNDFKRHLSELKSKSSPKADPMSGLLTPDGSGGGSPIADQNENTPSFTKAQVMKFYSDRTKGLFTPEKADEIEKQIEAAHKAGRIIEG